MRTRDQELASAIFAQMMNLRGSVQASSYGSLAHTLPVLIHTSGLAQALAFVDSRHTGDGPGQFLEDLSQVVLAQPAAAFLQRVRESEVREYLYLTDRTLAALLWYKRYAQSILGIAQGQNSEQDAQGGGKGGDHEV
ncbi:MAG TPA: type III-B CRISPR module-associated protein Cmr5 [Ktedonobacteraceae bacterium]|jgi:CRISPR-associated protein Cmr5